MTEPLPCGQTICPEAPLTLAEVRRRFARAAVRGVCDTGRYRCAYYAWGEGPPLTFIHGLGDTAEAYLPVAARLASAFRCIAYELPNGRGDGARLRHYTHAELVEDLFALLDHLGHERSYVLGSSFGATITLAALHARPERLPRGILAGGFAHRRLAPAERGLACLARWWPGSMRQVPLRTAISRATFGPRAGHDAESWEFFLTTSGTPPIAAVAERALLVHKLDLRPLLPAIRQPMLLVCGDCDPLVNRVCESELLAGLPHVQRVEIEECAHLAHYSHPDALAAVVRRFLTPPGPAPVWGESSCHAPCTNG